MEVILLEKVRNVGDMGDKANVKGGFARNFLIPQGKAARATKDNLAVFEERRAELEKKAAEVLGDAQARAKTLETAVVTIAVKASEEGKLYGSVGTREIAEALTTATGAEVNRSEVRLPEGALHELGEFDVMVQLHGDVTVKVTVHVVPE